MATISIAAAEQAETVAWIACANAEAAGASYAERAALVDAYHAALATLDAARAAQPAIPRPARPRHECGDLPTCHLSTGECRYSMDPDYD